MKASPYRLLPSVDRLLGDGRTRELIGRHGRTAVTNSMRQRLDVLRDELKSGTGAPADVTPESIIDSVRAALDARSAPSLKRVFNLTGTVLHTNLGRALLPQAAANAMMDATLSACNLEYDLQQGRRGERDTHVEALLCELTGAEAATIVNNNAAAVFIALNTLAKSREVVLSRGELIEIGGQFRIPDIMARAGCRLREVGTTNRTHLRDYAEAISPKTAALMRVHASNYRIEGFTHSAAAAELAQLAHDNGLAFINDLGSGTLVDLRRYGLPHEPTPQDALAADADVVTFSGDKLLGGPQCGIVVGRRELIARLRKSPLKRVLRVDKITLAALEAVLRLYQDPDTLVERLPTLRWLTRPREDIAAAAQRLLPVVEMHLPHPYRVHVVDCQSQIGSGSRPVDLLPSVALAVDAGQLRRGTGAAVARLLAALRALPVPVIGRLSGDAVMLDLRCLDDEALFAGQLDRLAVSLSA
jgi:L-seryl-tRNA(Ser) seleniumtransferase